METKSEQLKGVFEQMGFEVIDIPTVTGVLDVHGIPMIDGQKFEDRQPFAIKASEFHDYVDVQKAVLDARDRRDVYLEDGEDELE